jgi:Cu2+-exporting ATPase
MMVMMHYFTIISPTYFSDYFPGRYAQFLTDTLAGTSAGYFYLVLGAMTTLILLFTGGPILKGAYVSLRTGQPNMDLLVATAAVAAWVYSTLAIFVGSSPPHLYYDVTIAVVLVVTAGSYYENQIKRRATDRLADLTESTVDTARRYDPDGSGEEVPIEQLTEGERVLVREGERVPVDGTVSEGEGTVDEAVVTGESRPVPKRPGETVVGGATLQEGSLVVDVGPGAQSSVSRITDMVWNLQSATHGIQQLADRLATVFVPLVLALSAVVALANLALGTSVSTTLLLALTVLIVSCPCALGLATPLAIASSVREALERGIVVFDETIFERLRDVDTVVFDKTGTLTTCSSVPRCSRHALPTPSPAPSPGSTPATPRQTGVSGRPRPQRNPASASPRSRATPPASRVSSTATDCSLAISTCSTAATGRCPSDCASARPPRARRGRCRCWSGPGGRRPGSRSSATRPARSGRRRSGRSTTVTWRWSC